MTGSAIDPANSGPVYYNSSVVAIPSSYTYLGAGNFNGSGADGVLWENNNGQVDYWDMIGRSINPTTSGSVTYAGSTVAVASSYTYLGTGDFYGQSNNDTHSDVLWENSNGQLALWRMNGSAIDTGKSGAVTYNGSVVAVASSYTYLGIGDFYGNGSSGVLWENSNGQLALWSMNGAALNAAQSGSIVDAGNNVIGVSSDWHFLRVGDFKDDGTYNVVWQNNNGQLAYWDMQGRTLLTATSGLVTYNGSPIAVSSTYTGLHS
jgi:serralysin